MGFFANRACVHADTIAKTYTRLGDVHPKFGRSAQKMTERKSATRRTWSLGAAPKK